VKKIKYLFCNANPTSKCIIQKYLHNSIDAQQVHNCQTFGASEYITTVLAIIYDKEYQRKNSLISTLSKNRNYTSRTLMFSGTLPKKDTSM